jgi:uncharacterized protein (TIGR02266 family)
LWLIFRGRTRDRSPLGGGRRTAGTQAAFYSSRGDLVERMSAVGEERESAVDESSLEAIDPAASDEASRASLHVDVSLVSESQFYAGLDGNVASGGLFVATYRHLALGAFVDITLHMPDSELTITGCVQWSRDARSGVAVGVGIALVGLSAEEQDRIASFCRLRAPLYYEA